MKPRWKHIVEVVYQISFCFIFSILAQRLALVPSKMRFSTFALTLAPASFSILPNNVSAQCLNQVAAFNPNLRTHSANGTWFIVPVPKAAVQTALNQAFPLGTLSLLDVPASDQSIFPNGFPADTQPVLVSIARQDDIRMSALQIDGALITATLYATYVSQGGNQTPLAAQLNQYIAGENGPLPNGLVPAVASPLLFEGAPVRLGRFIPQAAPYQTDGTTLSAAANWVIIPNPVSGPGVTPSVMDLIFQNAATPKYTAKTFRALANQPIVLPSGRCQRNAYYFNNATALPVFRNGQVTLGPGASGSKLTSSEVQRASPDGSGVYRDVDGYSACAQNVGNMPQECEEAARSVDPAAL